MIVHGFAVSVYCVILLPVDPVKANVAEALPILTGLGELNLSGTTAHVVAYCIVISSTNAVFKEVLHPSVYCVYHAHVYTESVLEITVVHGPLFDTSE